MRSAVTVVVLAFAALLAVGCAGESSPAGPGPRMLIESQVPAFVDRVAALDPDSPTLVSSPDRFAAAIEEQGRDVCSHMIAGVAVEDAYSAAYPQAPRPAAGSMSQQISRIAADTLCPAT